MRPPDIEIYLKRVEAREIVAWLSRHFKVINQAQNGKTLDVELEYQGQSLACTMNENAAKGGYTSLWFHKNNTPWDDDQTCARAAFAVFNKEIRCVNGSWDVNQGEDDTGGWIRFTDAGESVVNWRA